MHCRTMAPVNSAQLPTMTTIFQDARPAGGRLLCELLAGHDGSHIALVTATDDGDQWWWLRWEGLLGGTAQVVQIDPCDAQLPQGRYADDCFLPAGHPGPHSFDLPPHPPRLEDHDPLPPLEEHGPARLKGHDCGMPGHPPAGRYDEDDFLRR
jgi:hypothetical protein